MNNYVLVKTDNFNTMGSSTTDQVWSKNLKTGERKFSSYFEVMFEAIEYKINEASLHDLLTMVVYSIEKASINDYFWVKTKNKEYELICCENNKEYKTSFKLKLLQHL